MRSYSTGKLNFYFKKEHLMRNKETASWARHGLLYAEKCGHNLLNEKRAHFYSMELGTFGTYILHSGKNLDSLWTHGHVQCLWRIFLIFRTDFLALRTQTSFFWSLWNCHTDRLTVQSNIFICGVRWIKWEVKIKKLLLPFQPDKNILDEWNVCRLVWCANCFSFETFLLYKQKRSVIKIRVHILYAYFLLFSFYFWLLT
jgi:hypothetical protein